MRALLFASAAAISAAAVSAQAPEWPGFRGPNRDGVAPSGTPPLTWSDDENVAWKVEMPGPGASSPVVAGDRLFVTCYSGFGVDVDEPGELDALRHHVLAFDRRSGERLWERSFAGELQTPPRPVYISEHGFASPTPVTDGKSLFVYFGDLGLLAFDLDGRQLWKAELGRRELDPREQEGATRETKPREGRERVVAGGRTLPVLRWGAAASPLLHDGLVIVNASEDSDSIRAVDAETGELVWKLEDWHLEGCSTSPIVAGVGDDAVVVIVLGGAVWGLDPKTGDRLWEVETDTYGGMSPTPLWEGDVVYTFGGGGKSRALLYRRGIEDPEDRIVWEGANQDIPSPLMVDGVLVAVLQSGMAVGVDALTGEQQFKQRLGGRIRGGVYASPIRVKDRIYLVSKESGCCVYSADGELSLLAKNVFESDESRFNGSPAVVGDRLYLRSDRFLYCVGEPEKSPPR